MDFPYLYNGINLDCGYRLDIVVEDKIIFSKFALSVLRVSAVNYPDWVLMRKTMQTKKPGNILFKLSFTLVLMALGGWLIYFIWFQGPVPYGIYTFSFHGALRC